MANSLLRRGIFSVVATGATAIAIGVVAVVLLRPFGTPGCDRAVLAQATSPNGAWVATIYNNVCRDGAFVTTVSDTVEITRSGQEASPVPIGVVFGMDDLPYGAEKPLAVNWLGPQSLQITIPNDAWAGSQRSAFADVAISYKYVPDDPIERACLKQWRSLPTDGMVRQISYMDTFLRRCRAEGGSR
jgi:hypothetical protein